MRNCPDGFVVAESRDETTVDDLEDASYAVFCHHLLQLTAVSGKNLSWLLERKLSIEGPVSRSLVLADLGITWKHRHRHNGKQRTKY